MPKIDVNEQLFFRLAEKAYPYDADFEQALSTAKAELDAQPSDSDPLDRRIIKIELNDTNRPDLWSTAGLARLLRIHGGGKSYKDRYIQFLSSKQEQKDCGERVITVDAALHDIRPFMTAFVISGKPIDEALLNDIIQTQEKLCWNFGRKRQTVAMGVYRSDFIKWPLHYRAVDPATTSFIPLGFDCEMLCSTILTEHPKGKVFGWILKGKAGVPLLTDAKNDVLSMAPVINSASIGTVQTGDCDLLVELTGTDMASLLLATNIVACDFTDAGYTILPVCIKHPYETGYGTEITTPYYFQPITKTTCSAVNKLLGTCLSAEEIMQALARMDNTVTITGDCITLQPPAYRNDFLHEVDIIEDVMMGKTVAFFEPQIPAEFTIGRLLPVTQLSRKIKGLLTGFGYQEMIFNYLGSKRDYIDNMNIDGSSVIEIANPMSENYQFVRPSIIPSLLSAEAVSANAVYPHRIFEIGKIAYLEPEENTGTCTVQNVGFLTVSNDANFNEAAGHVAGLMYYLKAEYVVSETKDSRFIAGRQAGIVYKGMQIGIFGELHPQVLENWSITSPAFAGELQIEPFL